MMAASLSLSVLEIIVLLLGAIILGIAIHFFISSRKSLQASTEEMERTSIARDEWKLRYFNDMEQRDKETGVLRQQMDHVKAELEEANENTNIYSLEAEEIRRQNKLLKSELENHRNNNNVSGEAQQAVLNEHQSVLQASQATIEELRRQNRVLRDEMDGMKVSTPAVVNDKSAEYLQELTTVKASLKEQQTALQTALASVEELRRQNKFLQEEMESVKTTAAAVDHDKPVDYLQQLRDAQISLQDHNQKIVQLLQNVDVIKEKEEMQQEILRTNEVLSSQLTTMKSQMTEKEKEITNIKQKEHLTKEMTSMLDIAYKDYNVLQDKIHKLEKELTNSKMMNLELEDLKESHYNTTRDLEEQRTRASSLAVEKQEIHAKLVDTEDRLRDAIYQKQQLQKRVSYLEELNADMQAVAEANKKLESQLRRVGELESMLNVVSEERDLLIRNTNG